MMEYGAIWVLAFPGLTELQRQVLDLICWYDEDPVTAEQVQRILKKGKITVSQNVIDWTIWELEEKGLVRMELSSPDTGDPVSWEPQEKIIVRWVAVQPPWGQREINYIRQLELRCSKG